MPRTRRPAPIISGQPPVGASNIDGTSGGTGNNSDDAGPVILTIDPASLEGDSGGGNNPSGSDTGERKRRGRKPGSHNRTKTQDTISIEGLSTILFSSHLALSAMTRTPELMLDPDEAALLAKASMDVMSFYDNMKIAPQTVAWVGLISALGSVYGPRFVALRIKAKTKAPEPEPEIKPSTMGDATRPQTNIRTANGAPQPTQSGAKTVMTEFGLVTVGERPH